MTVPPLLSFATLGMLMLAAIAMPRYARWCSQRAAHAAGVASSLPPLDWTGRILIGLGAAAALLAYAVQTIGVAEPAYFEAAISAILALFLMGEAAADRNWCFAPYGLMLPIVICSAALSPYGAPNAFVVAAGMWAGAYVLTIVQIRTGYLTVVTQDIVAALMPLLLFGVSLWAVATYLTTAAALALALSLGPSKPAIAAAHETGMTLGPARVHIPFCAVMFPILAGCLLWKVLAAFPPVHHAISMVGL
ncbi:hypothetical protein [Amorphus sp. 3PC139-8]|uniref:hypothetical protein n=1 Tax=Amorphus sp. 3PC139-8 TaxID=2735676 RepID=UPI00345CD33D